MKQPSNFRDLGGLLAGQKRIKPYRLLRSGDLSHLSDSQGDKLLRQYKLRTIVDLRSGAEKQRMPEVKLPGVQIIELDIMKQAADQVTSIDHFQKLTSASAVDQFMQDVYVAMLTNTYAKKMWRTFLEITLRQTNDALLFHCFAGKDRTGLAAAMILTLLGVSDADIMKDYLRSNQERVKDNQRMLALFADRGANEKLLEVLQRALLVRPEYLESAFHFTQTNFGSLTNYLQQELSITDNQIQALQENYLEEL